MTRPTANRTCAIYSSVHHYLAAKILQTFSAQLTGRWLDLVMTDGSEKLTTQPFRRKFHRSAGVKSTWCKYWKSFSNWHIRAFHPLVARFLRIHYFDMRSRAKPYLLQTYVRMTCGSMTLTCQKRCRYFHRCFGFETVWYMCCEIFCELTIQSDHLQTVHFV